MTFRHYSTDALKNALFRIHVKYVFQQKMSSNSAQLLLDTLVGVTWEPMGAELTQGGVGAPMNAVK